MRSREGELLSCTPKAARSTREHNGMAIVLSPMVTKPTMTMKARSMAAAVAGFRYDEGAVAARGGVQMGGWLAANLPARRPGCFSFHLQQGAPSKTWGCTYDTFRESGYRDGWLAATAPATPSSPVAGPA